MSTSTAALAVSSPIAPEAHGASQPIRATRTRADFDDGDSDNGSPHPPKAPRTSIATDTAPTTSADACERNIAKLSVTAEEGRLTTPAAGDAMADALLEELECGMCAGVYIDPVALNGCGHVFCGSCVSLWIKSLPRYPASLLPGDPVPEPIACPHCRYAPIQTATPSRLAKSMVAFLLARKPDVARPANEHRQAEEVYKPNTGIIKFPTPPPPPRQLHQNQFWRPCRSCYPEDGAWKCPVPVPRFDVPAERALCLRTDGLCPEGHRLCAGCDRLSPSNAPTSVSCAICGEGFCGDSMHGCDCAPVSQSKPTSQFGSLAYMLEDSPTDMLAMAFKDNWTEMSYLGIFLASREATYNSQTIYNSILEWLRSAESISSGGLLGLMNRADINLRLRVGMADEMQNAIMPVEAGETEAKVCGGCADEIFCAGLLEWWMREIAKPEVAANLPPTMKGRDNCKYGRKCVRQDSDTHAKKYNHICEPLPTDQAQGVHQDDTMPAPAVVDRSSERGGAPTDTDNESDSDDEEPHTRQTYTDAGVQYDELHFNGPQREVEIVRQYKENLAFWTSPTHRSAGAVPHTPTNQVASSPNNPPSNSAPAGTNINGNSAPTVGFAGFASSAAGFPTNSPNVAPNFASAPGLPPAPSMAPLPTPSPAFAISNLINATSASALSRPYSGTSEGAGSSSPPPFRIGSPVSGLRISGSASSPLAAGGSWTTSGLRGTQTPPLAHSFAGNNNLAPMPHLPPLSTLSKFAQSPNVHTPMDTDP